MKLTLGLVLLALAFWGSVAVIAEGYRIDLYPASPWIQVPLHYAGPWIALIGGIILKRNCRIWRQLRHLREEPIPLSRDPRYRPRAVNEPGFMERLAGLCILIAALSLIYWFDLDHAEMIAVCLLVVWLFRGVMRKALRIR